MLRLLAAHFAPRWLEVPCRSPATPRSSAPRSASGPILDYKCRICGRVFNIFTNTIWKGTHYSCATIVMIIRGIVQGIPTLQLAEELGLDYGTLLGWRHRIQRLGLEHLPTEPLPDEETEADEMFQNAGEKGYRHPDPNDPPRRRANKRRGRGTAENDRVPILGVVGRRSGQVRLTVCDNTQQATISPEWRRILWRQQRYTLTRIRPIIP